MYYATLENTAQKTLLMVCGYGLWGLPEPSRRPVGGGELLIRNGEFDGPVTRVMLEFVRPAMDDDEKCDRGTHPQTQAIERNAEFQDPPDRYRQFERPS